MNTIYQKLVMQVGACCCARGPYCSNNLALRYSLPDIDHAFMQVRVSGDVLVTVLHKYIVTVGTGVAGLDNATISGCIHRRTCCSGIVGASVWSCCLIDRVQTTHIEIGADAGEIERRHEEGFTHAYTFFIVIVCIPFGVGVTKCRKGLALVGEGSAYNIAVIELLTLQV